MKFDLSRDGSSVVNRDESSFLSPSALSTVGLRRATEARTISVKNSTGCDLHILLDSASFSPESGLLPSGSEVLLSELTGFFREGDEEQSLCLRVAADTITQIGEREPVYDLPIKSSGSRQISLHLLKPVKGSPIDEVRRIYQERVSPETVATEIVVDVAYYGAEPVVEWCMHNQRLAPHIVDVFSLSKGRDLLSSVSWSPEDSTDHDYIDMSDYNSHEPPVDSNGPEAGAGNMIVVRTERKLPPGPKNWIKPYLQNDSPEWTDMTCTLRMARDRVMLPDNNWMWVNDWTVDLSGTLGQDTDADGWEYQADFETFTRTPRYYQRGDACRRRRWTRTRMVHPPKLLDTRRQLKFVWETLQDQTGNGSIVIRSPLRIRNRSATPLSIFLFTPSWSKDEPAGSVRAGEDLEVPVVLASAAYMRLAKSVGSLAPHTLENCVCTDRFMILPTSQTSSNFVRTSMEMNDVSGTVLHFLIEVRSDRGIVDLIIEPSFRLVNLLPCRVECRVGQESRPRDKRGLATKASKRGEKNTTAHTETFTVASGKEGSSTALNPWLKPHISLRVPGYRWSRWQRIVNRKGNSNTWLPPEDEEELYFTSKGDSDFAEELTTMVRFERTGRSGDPLIILLSVECGHCPTLRVYSQYWIVDRTGFGCRYSEGFVDLLASIPDGETSRRSHLPSEERENPEIKQDMAVPGHQWSIGMCGMSMYFSKREKLTLAIEAGPTHGTERLQTKWISPIDISNVMPKTVFSVDQMNGPRQFELALNVTVCPGVFVRTKMITLFPRYQIVNLLHRELVIAQDGCLAKPTVIPSQSTVPFHWEKGMLPPKVRLGAPTIDQRGRGVYEKCWSNGRLQLDRVGITSMRLPATSSLVSVPMVIQAEVRLATKDQLSAVSVVIWSANEKSNPLYMLRNRTRYTILCRQPINDDHSDGKQPGEEISLSCPTDMNLDKTFECGTEIGPSLMAFLGLNHVEEFVWVLKSEDETCFGFDNPEKPHLLEWTCATNEKTRFDSRRARAFLEVDAMGSSSVLKLSGNRRVHCMIKAEHSTKVIEFVEEISFADPSSAPACGDGLYGSLATKGIQYEEQLERAGIAFREKVRTSDDDEQIAIGFRVYLPTLLLSVVDNANPMVQGREILLARAEKLSFTFSQTREGYHEFELRLMTFQVDNHVRKSIHPILVSFVWLNSANSA